jgi:hypothetical protein
VNFPQADFWPEVTSGMLAGAIAITSHVPTFQEEVEIKKNWNHPL